MRSDKAFATILLRIDSSWTLGNSIFELKKADSFDHFKLGLKKIYAKYKDNKNCNRTDT